MINATHFNLAERICRKHPDGIYRVALEEGRCAGTNTYTYGGLDFLSDKLASTLQNDGIKSGDPVVVLLPPSAAFLVAHLGILKLGAIVVPIPPGNGHNFLSQVILETQAKAMVIDETYRKPFAKVLEGLLDTRVYVATDYVSNRQFDQNIKGFWYEINMADSDFKIAETDETTPAYYFFEQKGEVLQRTMLTHQRLLSALPLKVYKETNLDNESIQDQPSKDWASIEILVNRIIRDLIQGQQISAP